MQGKQNPHCLAWFDDPRKFGLRKLCVSDRCLTFLGWETRGGFHQVHHHLYKGWVKDKGGKLLFKKGEIYCGGKGRWTLAHRWMSTPSLVDRFNAYETYGRFLSKKFQIFDICSGFAQKFSKTQAPKNNLTG